MLFTAIPKPKINFVREIITEWDGETDVEVTSIESLIKFSKIKVEFLENLDLLSVEKIRQIEVCTRGQCYDEQWHLRKKGFITASKAHEVKTKIKNRLKRRWGCSKHFVIERKKLWNDIFQSKHPNFKIWKRNGD